MKGADINKIANSDSDLQRILYASEQSLQLQAQQTAACNARHSLLQRMCAFLLRADEAVGGRPLFVTQENLAQTLGVQRASVSIIASQLLEEGAIEYRRGRVEVKDRAVLTAHGCGCNTVLEQLYRGRTLTAAKPARESTMAYATVARVGRD